MLSETDISSARFLQYRPELTTNILVRPVSAVLLAVAEEILLDAGAVTAGQLTGLVTQGRVGHQQRLHLPLPGQFITVLHSPFPVAGLLFEIESQTWRTSDSLQTLQDKNNEVRLSPSKLVN